MSLEEFLNEVEKSEEGDGNVFITIAKAQVFFCWRGWTNNISKLFEYRADNTEDEYEAKIICQEYIDSGTNEYNQWPEKGICTHIYGSDIPTNAEGKFYWGDSYDFVKKYENDANSNNLTEGELKLVSGPMPFNLVVRGIKANLIITDWKAHWVKMAQEVNQWAKAKGKKNKKGYDLRVHVIQHVYANEAEAKAEAEIIKTGQSTNQPLVVNNQLSAKAIETWGTLEKLIERKSEIEDAILDAIKGVGGTKKSPAKAREQIAGSYVIEESDLLLIGVEEVPF